MASLHQKVFRLEASFGSVTLWMVKDSSKRHLYLVNPFFFDTLLDVTIFFYIKWLEKKKEIVNFPCCSNSFNQFLSPQLLHQMGQIRFHYLVDHFKPLFQQSVIFTAPVIHHKMHIHLQEAIPKLLHSTNPKLQG